MYQALARAVRPAVTTVAAGAGAAAGASGSSVAHAEALRSGLPGPSREVRIKEIGEAGLTVFAGKEDSLPSEVATDLWSLVDNYGDISEEEVRAAIGPVTSFAPSPPDSDGFEAESVMHQTEGIIKNVHAIVNDRQLRESFMSHPVVAELMSTFQQNPQLLPAAASVLALPSTVTIEEMQDNPNPLKMIGDALGFIGNQIGKACNKTGNFFKSIAGKVAGKDGGDNGDTVFLVVLGLVVIVLMSIITKRAVR